MNAKDKNKIIVKNLIKSSLKERRKVLQVLRKEK